jgi:hypothetical protein
MPSYSLNQSLVSALGFVALVTLAACSSTVYRPLDANTPGVTYEKGEPGGTMVETHKLTATVTAIDVPERKVILTAKNGKEIPVNCGTNVTNLGEIRVGDVVRVTMTDELTVAMANASTPPGPTETTLFTVGTQGGQPASFAVETQQYTATITSIDLKRRRATLHFPDGSDRTFIVRKDVNLNERQVGEKVAFRVAKAIAIAVEKQ